MHDKIDIFGNHYCDNITDQLLVEEDYNVRIVNTIISQLEIPSTGHIVEYGCWRGAVVNALSTLYGNHRVVGFDISNVTSHPQIHTIDVRHLAGNKQFVMPIALAWNDLSEWNGSPLGKQAAFDHALNNLVNNGIYIEHKKCPSYIHSHPKLKLITENSYLLFFRYTI